MLGSRGCILPGHVAIVIAVLKNEPNLKDPF